MQKLSRRGVLAGGSALALAGLFPAIPKTPLTPRMRLMRQAVADDLAAPDHVLRLHFNENPYGPSRVALKAINRSLQQANHYAGNPRPLRDLLAELNGLTPDHVMIGAGSNEVLKVAALMAGLQGGSVVGPHPTYQALLRYADAAGLDILRVPVDDQLGIDLEAMRAAVREDTRLVYLVNPNNPIPSVIEQQAMREFVREMSERCLVFVDEAYHEYASDPAYGSMIELVAAGHRNLIVSRTASKIHGLAGLRVGFGFAHPELVKELRGRRTGDTSLMALEAARVSYLDAEFQAFSLRQNRTSLDLVEGLCERLKLRYVPSNTNFAFIETGMSNEAFQETMAAHGVRTGRNFSPFENRWSRISMSTPEEMAYFVALYERLFG